MATSHLSGPSFMREVEASVHCYEFLRDAGILQLAPNKKNPPECRPEFFSNSQAHPVYVFQSFPALESTSYSSLKSLFVDLMAGVAYFFSASTASAKQKIAAKMIVAVRRHNNLVLDVCSVDPDLESFIWLIVTGRLCPGDLKVPFARCNVGLEELRELAESVGHPGLYIATPFYKPNSQGWHRLDEKISPPAIFEAIAPVHRAPNPNRSHKKAKNLSLNLRGWYRSRRVKDLQPFAAVAALMKRIHQLREAGVWPIFRSVFVPRAASSAYLEDGGTVQVFRSPRGWRLDLAEYHSLHAFLIDFMVTACWLLCAREKFDRHYRLATMLDCVVRHWPLQNPKLDSFFEDITAWLWKLVDVPCPDLGDRDQMNDYLLHCDLYLAEFQDRFNSRTAIHGPVNVWTGTYLPPGTLWRKVVLEAIERRDEPWLPFTRNSHLRIASDSFLTFARDGHEDAPESQDESLEGTGHPPTSWQDTVLGNGDSAVVQPSSSPRTDDSHDASSSTQNGVEKASSVTNVRVKQEAVELIEVSSSSSSSSEGEDDPDLEASRGQKPPLTDGVKEGEDVSSNRKRELEEKLGDDYQERIGRVQELVGQFRENFPGQLKHLDLLDGHINDLRQSLAPAKLRKIVTKMLQDRCIENVMDQLGRFVKKFSALIDSSVKGDMEMCLDALGTVLEDSRMLVSFQERYDKKMRR